MNPIQRTMLTVSVFVLSFFLCWGGAHGMEKPEIVRLDAHYTANVVKISVHWQSANPVSVVQAIVGGEAHEIRIDPYDNRRNPDGYSGEAEILVNASPGAVGAGIPYVVQIEDDLRQKSEQVTGLLRTAAAGAAGGGGAGQGSDAFGTGKSGTDFQTDAGTQRLLQAIRDRSSRPGQGPQADPFDTEAGNDYSDADIGGGPQDDGEQYGPSGDDILQNDSGSIAYFLPLGPGDGVAVYLDNLGEPFMLEKVHFAFGGTPETGTVALGIYEESGTAGNLQERYSTSVEIPVSDNKWAEIDLASSGVSVPIRTGSVWISLEMGHNGLPGIGFDGSTSAVPGRNLLLWQGAWYDVVEDTDLEGNAIIRAWISDYRDTQQDPPTDTAQYGSPDQQSPSSLPPKDPSGGTTDESSRDRSRGDTGGSVTGSSLPGTSSGKTPLSPSEGTVERSETKVQAIRDLTTSRSKDAPASGELLSGKEPITGVSPKVTSSMTVSDKGERGPADVTGFSPTTVTLTRGGVARTVNVQGSGLQNAMVHVVKGSTVVRDVTASIRNPSATGCQVVLTAPSSGTSTGRDFVLRIVAGGQVVGQMVFSVVTSKDPVSVKPSTPIMTAPDGVLRR